MLSGKLIQSLAVLNVDSSVPDAVLKELIGIEKNCRSKLWDLAYEE